MAFLTASLKEETGDGRSPSNAAFNFKESHTVRTWFMENPLGRDSQVYGIDEFDLQFIVKNVLGSTTYAVNQNAQGKLNRVLPLADPLYPWLYASEIQSVRGVGTPIQKPSQLNTNSASFAAFALFNNYEITCDCTGRPYPVSPDEAITQQNVFWYDTSNTEQHVTYYPEWLRFCDFDIIPQEEWLDQQRGTSYFETSDSSEPGANAQGTAQQSVRMLLPNSTLRLLWVGVPLRYILSTNSYLNKFRGFINQNAWNGPLGPVIEHPLGASFPEADGGKSGVFAPGTLLYVGFKPRIYMPVLPVTYNLFGSFIDYNRLCDIEMFFLYTTRVGQKLPSQPTNKNIVVGGWNLLPYLPKRQFFYAYNSDLAGNKNPLFYSFPIELLFTDPDMDNAYTGDG